MPGNPPGGRRGELVCCNYPCKLRSELVLVVLSLYRAKCGVCKVFIAQRDTLWTSVHLQHNMTLINGRCLRRMIIAGVKQWLLRLRELVEATVRVEKPMRCRSNRHCRVLREISFGAARFQVVWCRFLLMMIDEMGRNAHFSC